LKATFTEKLTIGVNDIINPDQVSLQFNQFDKVFLEKERPIKVLT
jgi:hypothetical protein